MKLQHKAWVLVLVIVGLGTAAAMFAARHVVGASFAQLETERTEREGERARRVLDQQVQSLAATARDYAYWSDAVAFVRGRKPDFLVDNFDAENLGYLRISQLLVHDLSGRVIASVSKPGEDGQLRPVPADTQLGLLPLAKPVLASADPKTVLQTLRVVGEVVEVVVVTLVHDPDRPELGAQGAITMVRRLEPDELERFAGVLMTPTRLSFDLHDDKDVHVEVIDEQSQDIHAKLRDHLGRPVAELVMRVDRSLYQQGRWLAWTSMGLAALAGLASAFLLVALLDRLLLRRLQQLHADVGGITRQGPLDAPPVRVDGNDELSQLGQGINDLLERVRLDAQAQREAHEQQEALQMQLMQSQKTEALGRLTGGIAHDFNNSLAAITGWVRLAAEDLPDPEHPSSEALQQALKATRYADGLMRQLLAFGRQTPPKLRRLHWGNLIDDTRQLVASGLTKRCELVVTQTVADDEIDVDPTQMQQVMVNLLINASDAMQGEGRIEMDLRALELPLAAGERLPPGAHGLPHGRYLVLTVCDHGPGVPAELLNRVFEPFFTTKGKGRGTGLGLSVAQGIVQRHHGAIGLSNRTEGTGACFHLILPASRPDVPVEPITGPDSGPGQGRKVLFVDDDQLVRHAWTALLERQGWVVTRARDGEEGWTQYERNSQHFDLVLTDQSMPGLDGAGLARRIRGAGPASPPIILISGHVNEVSADDQRTLFNAVLHKPVDTKDLGRVMHEVLATGASRG